MPNDRDGPIPSRHLTLRQGYQPCSYCGRYGSQSRLIDGTRYLVSAPREVSVGKDERWTCRICVREGHPQLATSPDLESGGESGAGDPVQKAI